MAKDFLGIANPLQAGAALAGVGYGILQSIQARKLEKQNVMPLTSVNENLLKNVGLAEQRARVGLPSSIYNRALEGINTAQSAGLRLAGRGGTGARSIASIVRASGGAVGNLAEQDLRTQLDAERTLMQQRQNLAGEQQRVFNWNKANPYLRTAQQVASMRAAGTQNIFGGIGLLSAQAKPTV